MQYTYRQLQSMLRDARGQGFECVYPLNSKKANLEEMYEDYCAWRTYNQYKQETQKEDEPTWKEITDFAVNTSHMKVYQWSYRRIQIWLRTLRDRHLCAISVPLNSTLNVLTRELRHWLNHIKETSEAGRKRSEERQSWWRDYHRTKEQWQNQHQDNQRREKKCYEEEQKFHHHHTQVATFTINGVDIFSINVKGIGWLKPSQLIFGTEAKEIRRTWRNLATQHHPDHGGDKEVFQQLNNIHQRLVEYLR